MFVAGIDAHATYSVIAIVSNTGQLVQAPIRSKNTEEDRLVELLEPYRPLEVVVETSPAWPWLFDRLQGRTALDPPRARWPNEGIVQAVSGATMGQADRTRSDGGDRLRGAAGALISQWRWCMTRSSGPALRHQHLPIDNLGTSHSECGPWSAS